MDTATAEKCKEPNIEAVVDIQLPVDAEGTPFFLYNSPRQHSTMNILAYTCNTCGEQFGPMGWEEAQQH